MQAERAQAQRDLVSLPLYGGVTLIVVSMLFLGRGIETTSFMVQAVSVLAAPVFFYVVGWLIYRHLDAPLAAPGIVTTGAWLVAVGLIHLYEKRGLLPDALQAYYLLVAALAAAGVITWTSRWVRLWLLTPLVPLAQVNALWVTLLALGVDVQWFPALTFGLVLAWSEASFIATAEPGGVQPGGFETRPYRVSAWVLAFFLLWFSTWLPASETGDARVVISTWAACVVVLGIVALRHGVLRLLPLLVGIGAVGVLLALPMPLWSLGWVMLAAVSVGLGAMVNRKDEYVARTMEGAAAALTIVAAVAAGGLWFLRVPMPALAEVGALLVGGALLSWLGVRREWHIAAHAGAWTLAGGWMAIFRHGVAVEGAFGVWLALLAAVALLVDRALTATLKEKRKSARSITETVLTWPLADLSLGLSGLVLVWAALGITAVEPTLLALTLLVLVGVWTVAGLVYRLPALLHVAVWVAPIPYALVMLVAVPFSRSLPVLGLLWQGLALGYIVLGHALTGRRPALLLPFFAAGYPLLGFGLTLTLGNPALLPLSLGVMVVVAWLTSAAAALDLHPAWTMVVERIADPGERPFAFLHLHNAFLFVGAWLTVVWLQLTLGYTSLSLPRQGLTLVLLSGAWIVLGRLLARFPGLIGSPLYTAGWFMWVVGLVQVYYAPEAAIAAVLGLAVSVEALHRSRSPQWMPVFVLQVAFSVLQAARMLALPGGTLVMLVAIAVSAAGMWYERRSKSAGRFTALTGAAVALGLWVIEGASLSATLSVTVLTVAALLAYRKWWLAFPVYAALGAVTLRLGIEPEPTAVFVLGLAQVTLGVIVARLTRLWGVVTVAQAVLDEHDAATPLLWVGGAMVVVALAMVGTAGIATMLPYTLTLAAVSAAWTAVVKWRGLPNVSLGTLVLSAVLYTGSVMGQSFNLVGEGLLLASWQLALVAFAFRLVSLGGRSKARPFRWTRWMVWWVRPLRRASGLMAGVAFMAAVSALAYDVNGLYAAGVLLLLAGFTLMATLETRSFAWLWATVALAWLSWGVLLASFEVTNGGWYVLPAGVGLLLAAWAFGSGVPRSAEFTGILLIVSSGLFALEGSVWAFGAGMVARLVGLALYGWLAGRRTSFGVGVGLTVIGAVGGLVWMNPWLVPLLGGVALVGGALLLEVRRELVLGWAADLSARWRAWR